MKRFILVGVAMIVGAVGLTALPPHLSAADGDADDKAIRELTQRFYTAYAAKDLDAYMALWSEKSPDYADHKKFMAGLFSATGPIEVKGLSVFRVRRDGDTARVRVRVELVGNDAKSGQPHPHLGTFNRVLTLVREDGQWKVTRWVSAEAALRDALTAAATKGQRLHLLDEETNLVGPRFVQTLLDGAEAQARRGQFTRAAQLQDLAFELAAGLGDIDTLAWSHLYRGASLYAQSRYEAALSSYQKALPLFREANDKQGEGATLHNIGTVYQDTGRYGEALQQYQDSIKIKRDLGDRKGVAQTFTGIGNVYGETGRYAEALQQYQDSLKIERDLGDRAGEALTLNNIGNVYADTDRYAEALQQYQDSLKIERDLGDRAGEAQTLIGIGAIYDKTGRYAEALRQYQDALKIDRELGDRKGEASALGGIGSVYADTGPYVEALQQYQDALKIDRELGDRTGEATDLGGIGSVYRHMGRYTEALQQHQDSLKIRRELGDRKGEARALGGIGLVYADTGRYTEALQQHQDSLKIRRELGDRKGEATTFANIGLVYGSMGRYAEALQQLRDAFKIVHDLGDRDEEAVALIGIGAVYDVTGRYAEALQQYQDALKIVCDLGDRTEEIVALRNIGVVYDDTGRYEEALQQYQDALKIARELRNREVEASILGGIGSVYRHMGRYTEALQQYEVALKIARELRDRAGEAITLRNIGNIYSNTGKYGEALQRLKEALQIAETVGQLREVGNCYHVMGMVHEAQGQWRQAAQAYREAVRVTELLRSDAREPSLQISLLEQKTDPLFRLAVCLLELGQSAEAFAASEQMKARGLVDVLQQGKAYLRHGMSGDERKEEQRLQDQVTALSVQLEDLHSRKADLDAQTALAHDLDKARQDYDAFRRDLYLHRPDLQTRRAEFAPASLDDLSRSLFTGRPGLVVLTYLVGNDETLLFVLKPGDHEGGTARLTVHRIDVTAKDLAEAVDTFRDACSNAAKGAPDSDDFSRWLITPAADELKDARQVVIVPDGVLHKLPFQALKDPDDKYLIERFAVSYAPSVTALVKMQELGAKRRKDYANRPPSLLAVGISDFGRREKALPAAEPEARAVAGPFGEQGRLLLGPEATYAKVGASWGGRRCLHFATHGRLNEDAPLYSSLVLSPDGDEGALYARDLLDADIPAELVVMSACHTGEGKHVAGEGLLGMSWSWFAAGVPSVVASQWKVGDDSTAKLMKVFYARLKAGDSKAEALRQAELTLLADPSTRHPFYWAPFVLIGDDR